MKQKSQRHYNCSIAIITVSSGTSFMSNWLNQYIVGFFVIK